MLLRSKEDRDEGVRDRSRSSVSASQAAGRAAVGRRAADAEPRTGAGGPAGGVRRRRADAGPRPARGRPRSWMRSAGCATWDRRSCSWRRRRTRCWRSANTVAFMELGSARVDGAVRPDRRGTPRGHLPGDGDVSLHASSTGAPGTPAGWRSAGCCSTPSSSSSACYVHNPDKVGRDAGELIGLGHGRRGGDERRRRAARRSTPTASATWATGSARGPRRRSRR